MKPAKASYTLQRDQQAGLRRILVGRVPPFLRRGLALPARLCLDSLDVALGRRKELVPPRYLRFGGDGDFEETGNEFLEYFTKLGNLQPQHRVLEVGCGIGRMARPLAGYLAGGSYEGFDIVPRGIRWCKRHFGRRHPNFNFQLADVVNREYNPRGHCRAAEYRFPFKDQEFDFVFLTSVFTHMLKEDMEHYLKEIARTLRRDGKCLITYFLLNDSSRALIRAGLSSLRFSYPQDGCWSIDERLPENAVAYDENHIRERYDECGLKLETPQYGAWCGRKEYVSYQDILIAKRG